MNRRSCVLYEPQFAPAAVARDAHAMQGRPVSLGDGIPAFFSTEQLAMRDAMDAQERADRDGANLGLEVITIPSPVEITSL